MATLLLDPYVEEKIRQQRAACGGDRFDEVWEGVYVVPPLVDNEHQEIASRLAYALQLSAGWGSKLKIFPGTNVTDRQDDWTQNYRCPDVAVFTANTKAKDCGTHWLGGPDFAVEITSPYDRSREKLDFYSRVGVQELLLVDRSTWTLEFYRLAGNTLIKTGTCAVGDGNRATSHVLAATFGLVAGPKRPLIEVAAVSGGAAGLV